RLTRLALGPEVYALGLTYENGVAAVTFINIGKSVARQVRSDAGDLFNPSTGADPCVRPRTPTDTPTVAEQRAQLREHMRAVKRFKRDNAESLIAPLKQADHWLRHPRVAEMEAEIPPGLTITYPIPSNIRFGSGDPGPGIVLFVQGTYSYQDRL